MCIFIEKNNRKFYYNLIFKQSEENVKKNMIKQIIIIIKFSTSRIGYFDQCSSIVPLTLYRLLHLYRLYKQNSYSFFFVYLLSLIRSSNLYLIVINCKNLNRLDEHNINNISWITIHQVSETNGKWLRPKRGATSPGFRHRFFHNFFQFYYTMCLHFFLVRKDFQTELYQGKWLLFHSFRHFYYYETGNFQQPYGNEIHLCDIRYFISKFEIVK